MQKKEIETFYPSSQKEWRAWLKTHHVSRQSIWLVMHRKDSGKPTINWSEAVDEALCFGWIDSTRRTVDKETFVQYFSKRKPKGTWSKVNKEKIKHLLAEGKMAKAGLLSIETAKQNGSWNSLDEVEELKIPKDLEEEFKLRKGSKDYFLSLSKSVRKMMLHWVLFAKREETRKKRIQELAELAARKLKPKQF